jgi:hypothetical protein
MSCSSVASERQLYEFDPVQTFCDRESPSIVFGVYNAVKTEVLH